MLTFYIVIIYIITILIVWRQNILSKRLNIQSKYMEELAKEILKLKGKGII